MKTLAFIGAIGLVATALPSTHAQTQATGQAAMKTAPASAATSLAFTNGEVINVYPKEKKVLLKHGEIVNIGMGAMTMEFTLTDPKMLGAIKRGDKVRFTADRAKGAYVVTRIEVVK